MAKRKVQARDIMAMLEMTESEHAEVVYIDADKDVIDDGWQIWKGHLCDCPRYAYTRELAGFHLGDTFTCHVFYVK